MKVSVIVPLYNKATTLARTLRSIAGQTFGDFEVIVVDDGSTDGGERAIAALADPRFRLIQQANAGPGAARNRGLAEAAGEYVAFLDADDEWLPTFLEKSVASLETFGPSVAAVASGYVKYPEGTSKESFWRRRGLEETTYRLSPATSPQLAVYVLAYLSPCSTVARTAVVRRYGGFFDRDRCVYGEDSFLWLKVLLNEAVAVRFEPLVAFHTEASALSGNLNGARPVEPILRHSDEIAATCPASLRPLLDEVLALRSIRTASMLAYWGTWRDARSLLRRYCSWSDWRRPGYAVANLAATPLGALAGRVIRGVRGHGHEKS